MNKKETHTPLDETSGSGSMPTERSDEETDKQRIGRAQVELLQLLACECATRIARPDG